MKTIGIIGGMSWESTVTYYKIINTTVKDMLGGFHSAKCLIYSVDFDEIEHCQTRGDWDAAGCILADAARRLQIAGADLLLIATNTMHRVYEQVQNAVSLPVLHIADVTADALLSNKVDTVGLLGTRYTMEQDFYRSRLEARGITVKIPNEEDRERVNRVIFDELVLGVISPESKRFYLETIGRLAADGCGAVILGCTEIGLLIAQQDTEIPLYDTTEVHATRAALAALPEERFRV